MVAGVVACSEQALPGGEGTVEDLLLANAVVKLLLRHPTDALTVRAGGATVLDAAPWDGTDRLHEVVPVVGGGWLDVDEVTTDDGRVEVSGRVVPLLPDRPASAEGERRSVRYVLRPDEPWLYVEGADGLYVHPQGDLELFERSIVAGDTVYAWDPGVEVEDLGGALFLHGAGRLLVSDRAQAWGWLADGDARRLEGTSTGAATLLLTSGGRPFGRVGVQNGAFDVEVPPEVDGVRAEATGRATSETVPPRTHLDLPLGGSGTLVLLPSWVHQARPLDVAWRAQDGRSARVLVDPDGASLSLGAGVHELTLSGGPAYRPQTLRVELAPGQVETVGVQLVPRFDPGAWVALGIGRPCDRARDYRGSNLTSAVATAGDGLVWTVFAAEDDVCGTSSGRNWPQLLWADGVWLRGEGWSVLSWPWRVRAREALHGGVQQAGLGPADAAAALWGGFDDNRTLLVNAGWLDAVGPPHLVSPRPDLVALEGLDDLGPWLAWLDAQRAVVPMGPVTWVPVTDPAQLGASDVEQPLVKGNVVAGNGPLVWLTVDGLPPGEIVSAGDTGVEPTYQVSVDVRGGDVDRVRLIGEGGVVLGEIGPEGGTVTRPLPGGYLLAVAEGEAEWAVTGPVWLAP